MAGLRAAAPFRQQLRQHVGAGVEFLNAMVAHVHNIDGPVRLVYRDTAREIELPVPVSEAAPGHDELAGHIEFLDPEVRAVHHINIAPDAIDRDAPRRIELAFTVAARAELHQIAAQLAVELLHPMVVSIDYPHVALAVAGNAGRIMEIGIGGSKVTPKDDEISGVVELLHPVIAVVHNE